jgi:hypothetical protein
MTPTLIGRWQTRAAMLATLGLLVTLVFLSMYRDRVFLAVLAYVFVFGVIWDVIWILLQKFRWDRDWPAAFQVGSAAIEGVWLYAVISLVGLPFVLRNSVPLSVFLEQYGLVWLVTFIWVQGPMRTLFPRWRYNGGRIF